jgi:hypothetical protein
VDKANKELDAIEEVALERSGGGGDSELLNHLNPLTQARKTLGAPQGLAATPTGVRVPCQAVEQAPKNLRSTDFADIESAMKRAPDRITAAGLGEGRMPTGHQRVEWVFEDGSRLVVDKPRQLGGRPQSADRPHAELHGPAGERLDQQGIVVPEESTAAHMTITDVTGALEKHFAPARAKTD